MTKKDGVPVAKSKGSKDRGKKGALIVRVRLPGLWRPASRLDTPTSPSRRPVVGVSAAKGPTE